MSSKLEDALFEEFRLYGMPLPERQYKFHPTRKWKLDFAWIDRKIGVELDGGLFAGGRHNRGAAIELTHEKLNEAVRLGWQIYVFGPKACYAKKRTMQSSKALEFLWKVLHPMNDIAVPVGRPMSMPTQSSFVVDDF